MHAYIPTYTPHTHTHTHTHATHVRQTLFLLVPLFESSAEEGIVRARALKKRYKKGLGPLKSSAEEGIVRARV
jgi:hypothetical protein